MTDFEKTLFDTLKEQNFIFSEGMINKFCKYANLLVKWNKMMNLTAITTPEEIVTRHFLDSVSVLNYIDVPDKSRVVDVGTGAGFPGIPLKIVRPDIDLTLIDSLNKRLVFLKEVSISLDFKVNLVHARAEEASLNEIYREKYDFAFSRAVARLNILSEFCLPYVKVNGFFVAMKAKNIDCEVDESLNAIEKLGGFLEKVEKFNLVDGSERSIVKVRKINNTPSIYPRQSAKISKKPL